MYPNILITFNVDRMTRVATALQIDGIDQQYFDDLFGNAADPVVNGVHICKTYFGLPGYNEMLELYDKEHRPVKEVV